ncbi:LOW QUALITY PROTEIN: sodium-dependent phosphate transporter 2-like [Liolophura sinensis]|uniref:LOW QUALITY PROTEIN: sodium-dependent phosphate transporter 2-like n=1 Tax=Liolophura sinensis TaxID=3198878 RepID=UPI00315807AB
MDYTDNELWMVIVGFIVAFVLAFGIGANDVANSFGTSVGAKVLTMVQACILASIFEVLGAVLLGSKVSDTIRKGIIDVSPYNGTEEVLMVGNVSALIGSCIWLMIATFLRLPVSATHSIVGATLGFALVAHGSKGVQWRQIGLIIGSWFVSPVLSGIISSVLFIIIRHFILNKAKTLEPGLKFLPIFYAVTLTINTISILFVGSELLGFNKIPVWGKFVISFGVGIVTALVVRIIAVPWLRRKIKRECFSESVEVLNLGGAVPSKECTPEHKPASAVDQNNSNVKTANHVEWLNESEKTNIDGKIVDGVTPVAEKEGKEIVVTNHVNNNCESENGTEAANGHIPNEAQKPLLTEQKVAVSDSAIVLDLPCNEEKLNDSGSSMEIENEEKRKKAARDSVKDSPETVKIFSFLQILTAIFGSFAHGGNDVSNAIGPLVALWIIFQEGSVQQKAATPIWLLLYGGVGISVGLWVWGRRVIKTLGEDLTKITPSSGFCIEIGSAFTVLVASNVGIPISTTHCKVGSVVMVGRVRSREVVDWKLFRNIVFAWLVTLPVSGGISAGVMACLRLLL